MRDPDRLNKLQQTESPGRNNVNNDVFQLLMKGLGHSSTETKSHSEPLK